MFFVSAHVNRLSLPTMESKLSIGIGYILLGIITVIILLERVQALFKIKSIGILLLFLMLALLEPHIYVLRTTLGLMLIPLLIDDILVNGYFFILNNNKYWEYYRDVIKSGKE